MNGVGEVLSEIVPTRKSKPDPSGLSKVWHDCFKPDWQDGRVSGNETLDQDTVTQMAGSHRTVVWSLARLRGETRLGPYMNVLDASSLRVPTIKRKMWRGVIRSRRVHLRTLHSPYSVSMFSWMAGSSRPAARNRTVNRRVI